MYVVGIVGCGILLFGPYVETCAVCIATGRPQLVICALLAATLALAPSVLSSLLYVCWRLRWRWTSPWPGSADTPLSTAPPPLLMSVALLLLHNCFVYATRVLACWCAWHVQAWLRRTYQQVIVYSRFRFSLVSLSVGLGFGFTSAVVLSGAVWFDAALQTVTTTAGVATYNVATCPQLPTLLHASLQSALLTCCHAAWGVMVGQSVAAVQAAGPRVFWQLLHANTRDGLPPGHTSVSPHAEDARRCMSARTSPPRTAVPRGRSEYSPSEAPQATVPVTIIPADTRLVEHPMVVCVTLVATAAMQLIFSLLPFFHRAAVDFTTGVERASRGCVVSLPLQLVVTTISVLYALWLMRVEHVKLD